MRKTFAAAFLLALAAPAGAAVYEIDAAHSSVGFRIRHLISKVNGRFDKVSGTINFEAGKPKAWKASAEIDAASINTNNEKRDGHLRSADFFYVEKCPKLSFASQKVETAEDGKITLSGALTMHCVSKPVALDLEVGESIKDPWGNDRVGFTARGALKRKDFGIVWNKVLDSGGVMLGDDVEVTLDIEAVAKKAAAAPKP